MSEINIEKLLIDAGLNQPLDAIPVAGGWSSTRIWQVKSKDDEFALKIFPEGVVDRSRYEASIMKIAASQNLPVPDVCAAGEHIGHPYLLVSWCPGKSMLGELKSHPWNIRNIGTQLGQTQARINAIRLPERFTLPDRNWIDWPSPALPEIRERVQSLLPACRQLLHLDFHPQNVLIDGGFLSSVLDWTNALPGDPRADVARTLIILRYNPLDASVPTFFRPVIQIARHTLAVAYLDSYQQIAGPLRDMEIFLAWAAMASAADLEPKVNQPGVAVQLEDIDRLRSLAARWLHQISRV